MQTNKRVYLNDCWVCTAVKRTKTLIIILVPSSPQRPAPRAGLLLLYTRDGGIGGGLRYDFLIFLTLFKMLSIKKPVALTGFFMLPFYIPKLDGCIPCQLTIFFTSARGIEADKSSPDLKPPTIIAIPGIVIVPIVK